MCALQTPGHPKTFSGDGYLVVKAIFLICFFHCVDICTSVPEAMANKTAGTLA